MKIPTSVSAACSARLLVFVACVTTLACLPIQMAAEEPADLVLSHAKIVTLQDAQPEAQALAIRGERIVAVGTNDDISHYIGEATRTIRLDGELVIPGFIESHAHFVSLGKSKMVLDLTQATTWEDLIELVVEAAGQTPLGSWIVGRGWHQGKWVRPPLPHVQGYPVHTELSRKVPDQPVLLTHGTGHMVLANAKAMELAGVDKDSRPSSGGEMLRDPDGNPTGVFRENAAAPIHAAFARSQRVRSLEQQRNDRLTAIRLASRECLAQGVTSFQDAGTSFDTIDLLRELANRDELQVRLWAMLSESNDALARRMAEYRMIGAGNNYLTVRAVKRLIDGALGTHGAWMLAPYEDLPTSVGHNTTSPEQIRRAAELALQHGYQMCVHAIGDRANRVVLDLFEEASNRRPETDLRWRIEHAQHIHPHDIPRFARLNVIASMQGVHCTSDAPFVISRLGHWRARTGAYVWRSLLDAGAIVINGTDAPVERVSPIECFYASVTRRLSNDVTFFPEQRMSRLEALQSYTRDAAYAAFEEKIKGTLEPGKLADVVVLSKDILTIPDHQIRSTRILYTIVGGRVRYTHEPRGS